MPIVRAASDACYVLGLRTESVDSPMGVETNEPLLSWRIVAGRRGVRQTAYRIEVAQSEDALTNGRADLWDSGRVVSATSIGIRYEGKVLSSRQRCFWRVRIWDERGVVASPSATAWWEMGLLDPSDWSAQWLVAEDRIMREDREFGLGWVRGPAPSAGGTTQFRRSFSLAESAEATLFIASFGRTNIWIDGIAVPISSSLPVLMGPPPSVEIALPLRAGRHVLAATLDTATSPLALLGPQGAEMAPFVRIATNGGVTRINNTGWKTSVFRPENWQMVDFDDQRWIDAAPVRETRPQPWPKQSAMMMRRAFITKKPVSRARIYVTALGAYELHLNGRRVGDALLTPESTDFRKRALYRIYDVTEQVVSGENVIGALVGDGWYASYMTAVGRYPWGPAPRCLRVQLELTYPDDSRELIESGPQWQGACAPIVSSEIYDGECYDARLEQPGWSSTGFDASRWSGMEVAPPPPITLTAQISPPIRSQVILTACNIIEPRPGVFVYDFGQNFAGWCRLVVSGPAGARIELRYAETLKDSGEVDQANLRSARATDAYILKGDPQGETFEPHFTYHGFRYVQVHGFPGSPTSRNLEGVVIHSDLKITGGMAVDNPLIQRLCENTLWSQRSNFMGIPTDCPQRDERLGWLGDANVFWDAAAFNMDVLAFTRRFMSDVRDAQADDGAFADFNPAAFRLLVGEGGKMSVLPKWADTGVSGRIGASPGWADAGVCLPWIVWQRYGDTAIIEENWRAMTRYLQFIHQSNPEFIWRNDRGADYGDWLSLDARSLWDPTTPKDLVATATWAHSVACMGQMAEATARSEEARDYRALWTKIANAFQKNFIASDGAIGNGSQTGYVLALHFDLVPEALRSAAAARLAADIKQRGTVLSTGFLGTTHSLDVLANAGYSDLVYSLLLRTEAPSWGHMVAQGATTIWESWNNDKGDTSVGSLNHYALGAVSGFIFRRLAGIAPLEPGFRRIEVRPVLDPRVKACAGKYESVLGQVATRWRRRDSGEFDLDLTVPPNATAIVYLPATPMMAVEEGRRAIDNHPDIRELMRTSESAIVEVGSGRYEFAVGHR
jgi:alpha-L-rhamnosidase